MTDNKTVDYQVGDRILLDTTKDLKKLLIFETIHDCGIVTDVHGSSISILYKDNHPFIFRGTETEKVHINIDHLLRTKDAEISALKAQITDPWCYDISKIPKDQWVLASNGINIFYGINGDFWTITQTAIWPATGWQDNNWNTKIICWKKFPELPSILNRENK